MRVLLLAGVIWGAALASCGPSGQSTPSERAAGNQTDAASTEPGAALQPTVAEVLDAGLAPDAQTYEAGPQLDAQLPEFDCKDLSKLNMAVFPTATTLRAMLKEMVALGPRHTGSAADHAWIDTLELNMREMGLTGIARDEVTITGKNLFSQPYAEAPTTGQAHNLFGFLPGVDDSEYIVLGVHSDGQNSIEENGTVALLELMRYFSQVPRRCRKRTMVLAYVTCHMAACDHAEAPGFSELHPEIMEKSVIFFAPEHIGHRYRDGRATISYAFNMYDAPSLQTKVASLIAEVGVSPAMMTGERIGTSALWASATGKPVLGSMAYWDTLAEGLTDATVGMDQVDAKMYFDVAVLYGRMIGYVQGLPTDQIR